MSKPQLKTTDSRFSLAKEGFTCFLEFDQWDWNNYNRWTQACRATLGEQYWSFGRYHRGGPGKWKGVFKHKYRDGRETRRIYFRGDKVYTMMLMAVPAEKEENIYL